MPGYVETTGKKLLPVGSGWKIYDLTTVSVGTIQFFGVNTLYEYNKAPFAISITEDGDVDVSQNAGTESLNPIDAQTITILNITGYRACKMVDGSLVISPTLGAHAVKATGQTVVTDTTPPTITSVNPSGTAVSRSAQPTYTCSEDVVRGASGSLTLWNETLNSAFETFNVATAPTSGPGGIAITANQIQLFPSSDFPGDCVISLRATAGAVKDLNNNNLAAITTGILGFTTQPVVTPISSFAPDVVVTTATALNNLLNSWASNPSGTAPAGKTAFQDRVIGISATINGLTISGKNMPMKCYIRAVGTFGFTSMNGCNEPSCSTYINGVLTISGCNNIYGWRLDVRAANGTTTYSSGLVAISNSTNCGFMKSVIRGWPHQLIPGTYGTTATGVKQTGGSNILIEDVVCLYVYDSEINTFGTTAGLTWRGCMARHTGGNSFKVASLATASDLLIEACYQARSYHPYKNLHGDWLQVNNNPKVANDGGVLHRLKIQYCVGYRGHWTGQYWPNSNGQQSDVTQFGFINPAEPTSTGPHDFNDNLVITGQSRGVARIPGSSIMNTKRNTMLDPVLPVGQNGQSPFPRIISTDVSEENYITAPAWDATVVVNQGTNGIRKAVSADHHEILDEHMAIPTDLTDLYDIRPRSGTRSDPFYATPSQRWGCYNYWTKMLLGDSTVLPSKRGWPVDRIFIEDFDPSNRFGATNYTGNYDGNGDPA